MAPRCSGCNIAALITASACGKSILLGDTVMGRPKKLGKDAMLKIVDGYYESCGDADKLKYSLLEEYAASLGFDVKAYDFRRDAAVRDRMDELRGLSMLVTGDGAIAYKNLDVDGIISRSRNLKALRGELLELDGTWRKIYDQALASSQKNKALVEENRQQALRCEELAHERGEQALRISRLSSDNKALSKTNAYLKKTIKAYLYPAIANEILKSENVLEQADTEAMPETMAALVDAEVPSPFSKAAANESALLSREESLLLRMKKQASGGGSDA